MGISELKKALDWSAAGQTIHGLVTELYPICRSITGDGVRETLRRISELIPLRVHEVPTGTHVFDWTVPREWNIIDAYIKDSKGTRVVDFKQHNLHVLGYSAPVRAKMPLSELREHLFTIPEYPEWIPYRTSYYEERWGFCLSQRQMDALEDGEYEVCIDSRLEDGHLTYGEYCVPGEREEEVFFSCHICHPSLANDNLSAVAMAAYLAAKLKECSLKHSHRFVFAPGTIGAIAWLARNEAAVGRIRNGLVLSCVGDSGPSTYKKSRRGDAEIDTAAVHVLEQSGDDYRVLEFSPYGYDERQYCSPGFNLPVGCLMRSPPGSFPEYHTSADNPDLVRPEFLADSLRKWVDILEILEHNATYRNRNPKCEPQLGKRGLYSAVGGETDAKAREMSMLWVLNYSDGGHSLLDIALKAGIRFDNIKHAADALRNAGLLEEAGP